MILGDTFVSLLSTAGFAATKVPVTIGLTGAILLPLCLMKNLSSLAPFSLVGSLGMLYTAIAMSIRLFGKAYSPTGKFGLDMVASLRPKFGTVGAEGILSPNAAILVGMLSTAYMVRDDYLVWLCSVALIPCLDFILINLSLFYVCMRFFVFFRVTSMHQSFILNSKKRHYQIITRLYLRRLV